MHSAASTGARTTGPPARATTASAAIAAARRTSEHDHHEAAVVAVGEHAADRPEHDLGQDSRGGRDPDPHRGSGALVDEREQREVVQPVAGLGHDQAGEQATEVALTQRNQERLGGVQHGRERLVRRRPVRGSSERASCGCSLWVVVGMGHSLRLSRPAHIGLRTRLGAGQRLRWASRRLSRAADAT